MPKPKMPQGGHARHLCCLVETEFHKNHSQDYKALVKNARFLCRKCGRSAIRKFSLCHPVKL